jgi:ATP phosphoribosyltransferase regulatory subunit
LSELELSAEDRTKLTALIRCSGAPAEALATLKPYLTTEAELAAFAEFQSLCRILQKDLHVRVDFSVGNDLKYYSGVVFKGYLEGITTWVLSGGQYDKLLQKMGRGGNAVGFAIYLNLLEQIRENPRFDVDTVLLYAADTPMEQVLRAAQQLRKDTNVLTVTKLPENLRWRRLYKLTEGEAVIIEDNG